MTEAIRKILDAAEQAHRENRLLDVKRGCVEAISLLRQEGAGADLANVTRRLAETERKLGERDAAIQRYGEAVALYREVDEPLRLAHTIRHLGDVLYEAGRADLAEPHFQEALAIYRAAQPQPSAGDLANAIRSMAVLKDEADEIEQAIALWSEARSLYATLNYPPAIAETSARLALLALRQGDRERAREYLGEAKAAAARCDDVGTLDFTRKAEALVEG
jgi:tetratricopeptide (TPR) repeat protein